MPRNEPPAWVGALAILFGLAATVWATWCSIVVLIGGTMPLIAVHLETGSILGFILMLFIGEPILITLAYWASMIILVPLAAATSRRPGR
ncbi:hypothetical protein [Streptomyces glomeratus]|uniref:Uncharacterized protein n=1 Tax=Streptomyces glomeratus TaxID=284452 RepID=A0ABP6LJW3_9ACTN|nr:hypothetical protein [Streptomyces glomeratus]MCF1512306.1 hypothetical protein [Streptomyces glomeratus]